MMTRVKLAAVAAVLAVGVSGASIALATTTGAKTPKPPPGYKSINDPRLLQCQRTHAVCNPTTQSWKQIEAQAISQPPVPGAPTISMARAESLARHMAAAKPAAPVYAARMTGSQAMRRFGFQRNFFVNESRTVWIVTVHTKITPDALVPVAPKHYYSAVIDAATGILTDDCIGCNWVKP